jgi:tricorn protease-like protein
MALTSGTKLGPYEIESPLGGCGMGEVYRVIATPGLMAKYEDPRFSPNGTNIAVTVTDSKTGAQDIWTYPAGGGQPTRVTFTSRWGIG